MSENSPACCTYMLINVIFIFFVISFPLADHTHLCHGIVVWMEYELVEGDDNLLSEGLLEPPMKGSELVWSSDHNQGVCFFMDYEKTLIQYSVAFNTSNGEMKLKFL